MNTLYGSSISQYLPTGDSRETDFYKKMEENLIKSDFRTPDNIKSANLLDCDLEYPSNTHEKNKTFSFNTQIRKTTKVENNSAYMLENKPKIFMATETLTLEQTNEEKFPYNIET